MNFIYCLDKNYNTQAIMSFYTLNKFVNETINVYVVHNKPETLMDELKKFNFNNLIFKFLKFENKVALPNLKNSHVTEATYYRIFAINLLDIEIEDIIYVDSDILFNKNPASEFKKCLEVLKSSDFTISASTIGRYKKVDEETDRYFEYLGMDDKYFNAGVMLVNLQEWKNNNYSVKANLLIQELKEKARFWDQDILNSLIDSNYYTLQNKLNFKTVGVGENRSLENVIFVHYSGKSKPWDAGGVFEEAALIYHKFFRQLFKNEFHIKVKNRRNALNKMFNYRSYYKFLKTGELIRYLVYSFIAILKK